MTTGVHRPVPSAYRPPERGRAERLTSPTGIPVVQPGTSYTPGPISASGHPIRSETDRLGEAIVRVLSEREQSQAHAEAEGLTRTLKRYKVIVGALAAITTAVGAGAGAVWSYVQAYADERVEQADRERARAAIDAKVEQMAAEAAEHPKASQSELDDLEGTVRDLSRYVLEANEYTLEVLCASARPRRCPTKGPDLVEAEGKVRRRQ